MKLESEPVILRKLIASEGKIIVSKETKIDEETGEEVPVVKSKKVYLGKYDSEDNYITIDLYKEKNGRCYDSFWDRHGVVGECSVIAISFTELIERLLEARVKVYIG